jgi:hypothetical protein
MQYITRDTKVQRARPRLADRSVCQRIKRSGITGVVKDELVQAVRDLKTSMDASDTVHGADAVRDSLAKGIKNLGAYTSTATRYSHAAKLKRLSANDVDNLLDELTGTFHTEPPDGTLNASQ